MTFSTPDLRNVKDCYKNWMLDLIKADQRTKLLPCALLFSHVQGDFNLACLVRTANNFSTSKVYYYGQKRHWDKRGAVGTYNYTDVFHLNDLAAVSTLKEEYIFIGLENNCPETISLQNFIFPRKSLLVVGEESKGISPDLLPLIDCFVEIPSTGTVRSLNAAVAASIVLWEYFRQQAK